MDTANAKASIKLAQFILTLSKYSNSRYNTGFYERDALVNDYENIAGILVDRYNPYIFVVISSIFLPVLYLLMGPVPIFRKFFNSKISRY